MHTLSQLLLVALTSAVLPGPNLGAQARAPRPISFDHGRATFTLLAESSTLVITRPAARATTTIANSVWNPGAMTVLGDAVDPTIEYLIGGVDDQGTGIVQFIQDAGSTVSLRGTASLGSGSDACGIAYSAQSGTLYVLDGGLNRIVASSYVRGGSLPSLWTEVATVTAIAQLARSAQYDLALAVDDPSTPQLALYEVGAVIPEIVTLTLTPDGPELDSATPSSRSFVSLDPDRCIAGATTVTVHGPPGTRVHVVEISDSESGSTLASATMNAIGKINLTLPRPLDMARVYAARRASASTPTEPYVVPTKRWGLPGSLSTFGGHEMLRFGNVGLRSSVGNKDFYLTLRTYPIDGAQISAPATYKATLIMGIEGVHGFIGTPQGPIIANAMFADDTLEVIDDESSSAAFVPVPIPDIAALEGTVLLAQWIMSSSSEDAYYISDIVGFRVRDSAVLTPHQTGQSSRGIGQARKWLAREFQQMTPERMQHIRSRIQARR